MRRTITSLLVAAMVGLVVACGSSATPTPTPTREPTPTPTPLPRFDIAIEGLACTDLYPGARPPPGTPSHTLTASGTVGNLNASFSTVDRSVIAYTELTVETVDGVILGRVEGSPVNIRWRDRAVPLSLRFPEPPSPDGGLCRVRLTGTSRAETIAFATAPIVVVNAP